MSKITDSIVGHAIGDALGMCVMDFIKFKKL